jgi:hypothetical protein
VSEIRHPDARSADEILRESENFFAGKGAVHTTLRSLVDRLAEESIPYAIDPSVRAEYRRLWELAQHAGEGPQERG